MIEYSTRVVTPEQEAALADYHAARTYAELDAATKRMRELGMLSAGEGFAATVDKLIAASESEPKTVVLFVSEDES